VTAVSFTVPGPVEPWRRARTGKTKSGKTLHFKDGQTAAYQNLWKLAAEKAHGSGPLLAGPLSIVIIARFVPPASTSKKRLAAMLAGEIRPTRRPDFDNIAKNVDALNGVVWRDDAQVADAIVRKFYAETPGVDVSIELIGAPA
jgi:Holliday junction resolvase RusA-like endonuclease